MRGMRVIIICIEYWHLSTSFEIDDMECVILDFGLCACRVFCLGRWKMGCLIVVWHVPDCETTMWWVSKGHVSSRGWVCITLWWFVFYGEECSVSNFEWSVIIVSDCILGCYKCMLRVSCLQARGAWIDGVVAFQKETCWDELHEFQGWWFGLVYAKFIR